jgi:hypothetical protein
MPTSGAPDEAARIRRAAEAAVARAPVSSDPSMRALREAVVGDAALVRSAVGEPAFWLVPFEVGGRACGFARVELSGRVAQVSRFGAGADDRGSWPEAGFFRRPPARILDEVRTKHPGLPLAEPALSYDGSPAKWAWRIAVGRPVITVAYITPGGWYEKPVPRGALEDRAG